jgi:phosphate/phosphite/phosphonate ABC transporter binding protein
MKRLVFFLPILIALHVASPEAGAAAANPKTITLGFVSEKPPAEVEAHLKDFIDYVGKKLSLEGKVVAAPTVSQLARNIEQKRVDFYMDSPYPTYLINRSGGAMVVLRRWKSGMGEYHSIVFTKKDGPVKQVGDLKGKLIAFEDPGSTSAYFLPKIYLMKKGLRLTEKAGPLSPVGSKETGYIFTYSTATTVDLVVSGKAAGGAFSNDDYNRVGDKQAQIVKLAETDSFPRNLVSVRKDLNAATAKRLKEVLLAMDKDEEGKKVLAKTDETNKFDALPGGEEAMRRQLQNLFQGKD